VAETRYGGEVQLLPPEAQIIPRNPGLAVTDSIQAQATRRAIPRF
jgi:hypothetical protein